MGDQNITPVIQLWLLSRDPIVPEKLKHKDFVKAMVTDYLKINIDDLDGDQRTELYKVVNALLETYKEKKPAQHDPKSLKRWMCKKVNQFLEEMKKRKEKQEAEQSVSANQSEWVVIDETGSEGSSSISGGEASQSSDKVTKTVENSDNPSSNKKTNSSGIKVISVEVLKNAIEPKENESGLKITNVCTLNASTGTEIPNLANIQKAVKNDENDSNVPRKEKTEEILLPKSSSEHKVVTHDEESSNILQHNKNKELLSPKSSSEQTVVANDEESSNIPQTDKTKKCLSSKSSSDQKVDTNDEKSNNIPQHNKNKELLSPKSSLEQKVVTNDEKASYTPETDKTKECLSSKSSLEQKKVINDEKSSNIPQIEKTKEFSSPRSPLETPQKSFQWNNYKIPKKSGNNTVKTVGNPNASKHPTLPTPPVSSSTRKTKDQDIFKEMMTNKVSERIQTSGSIDKISKKIKERRSTIDISGSEKAMKDVSASKLNTPGTSKKIKERRSTCAPDEGVATTKSETDNTIKKIKDRRSSNNTSESVGKTTDNVKGQKDTCDEGNTENRKINRKGINTLDSWCLKKANLPVENVRNEERDVEISKNDSTSKKSDSETKPKKKNKKKSKKRNRLISSSSVSDIESIENCTAESVLPTIESSDDFENEATSKANKRDKRKCSLTPSSKIADDTKVPETPSHDTESKVEETPKPTSWDVTKFHDMKFMKSHCLAINGTQNQVRNYFFQMNPTTNIVSLEKGSSVDVVTRMYDLKELLYWPGVGVKLELPGITITRQCESNFHSELVGQNASKIPSEYMKVNKNEVFYFHSSRAQKNLDDLKPDIELSYNLVVTYLEIIMKCLTVTNYVKGSEIELILCTMLKDLKMISRCFQNRAYSYFLSDRPYYRVLRQDVELGSNHDLLHLREFCNPEIIFEITQCNFKALKQVDFEQLMSYFTTILIEKNADAIEDFNAMLSKGYTLYCTECEKNNRLTGKFTSSKRISDISNHIGPYCTTDFNCVKCGFHADVAELAKINWKHECEE